VAVKLDDRQAARALNARAKKYLGMTGREFLAAARRGTLPDTPIARHLLIVAGGATRA